MPCVDYVSTPSQDEIYADRIRNAKASKDAAIAEGLACAVIRHFGIDAIINQIDCVEAGLDKKDIKQWWKEHSAKDAARIAKEQSARKAEEARKAALAKLTPAERKLLGVG